MRAVVMEAPGRIVIEDIDAPKVLDPTDAVIELAATCICGSDLWPFRGAQPVDHQYMGHEYIGEVVETGPAVKKVVPGDFVVGSFCISCGECEICRAGYPSRCPVAAAAGDPFIGARSNGTQAEFARVPFADGTLVKTPAPPSPELIPHLLAASDVLGTGWFAADSAGAGPGTTIAVVGTAPSAWARSSARSSWARSASSPCPATRSARPWPASSAPPTSSRSAARRERPASAR